MLSIVAHIEVVDSQGCRAARLAGHRGTARKNPQVVGAAPFVAAQALIARG